MVGVVAAAVCFLTHPGCNATWLHTAAHSKAPAATAAIVAAARAAGDAAEQATAAVMAVLQQRLPSWGEERNVSGCAEGSAPESPRLPLQCRLLRWAAGDGLLPAAPATPAVGQQSSASWLWSRLSGKGTAAAPPFGGVSMRLTGAEGEGRGWLGGLWGCRSAAGRGSCMTKVGGGHCTADASASAGVPASRPWPWGPLAEALGCSEYLRARAGRR